jgi:outer membrane protein assembly factor BamB
MWTFAPAGVTLGVYPSTVNSAGSLVFAPARGAVFGVDASSGNALWTASVPPGSAVQVVSVATDDDIVVAAFRVNAPRDSGGVIGLDASSGAQRWLTRFPVPAPDSSTGAVDVTVSGSSVFASADDGRVVALDRATGAIKWTAPGVGTYPPSSSAAGQITGYDIRTLTVQGEVVYATSVSGWLSAYSASNGIRLWRSSSMYLASIAPTGKDDSTLFLASAAGTVTAIGLSTHSIRWRTYPPANFFSLIAPVGPHVYAMAVDGYYAIKK